MPSANQSLAAIFGQMADVMQILGHDSFRINAFRKSARILDDLAQDVADIGPDIQGLTAIAGIGEGTARRIAEFLATGRLQDHQALLAQVPPGLPGLLAVPGLGPKTVALFWKSAGVDSLDALKAALRDDRLADLPGMGPKKIENLRKNLAFIEQAGRRMRLGDVWPVAQWFVERLRTLPGVKQAEFAGSLRRGRETIGDLDLLVAAPPEAAAGITQAFVGSEPVGQVLAQGPTRSSVRLAGPAEGLQVDLRIVAPESFGAALMYFTGSKDHNVALRERAVKRGMKLSEYGLFRAEDEGGRPVAGATEDEVFRALELDWVPPELREDRGEIDLAGRHALPKLLALDDIRAELHAHTTASDGRWSIQELAAAAAARGFHTVAVTDHSASQVIANGLSAQRLEQHIQTVREAGEELAGRITLLAGTEVDILADGELDYPDSLLKELDIVIASPHSALSQDPATATARLLRAIQNPYVTILGHPTGRLINRREGLSPDLGRLIAAARERGVALEINANAYRLDLRDAHARAAVEAGVKLAINTDAHGPGDLDHLQYGVLTARRAGATAADVVNCLPAAGLRAWLRATRR